jgi:hypothetical protein
MISQSLRFSQGPLTLLLQIRDSASTAVLIHLEKQVVSLQYYVLVFVVILTALILQVFFLFFFFFFFFFFYSCCSHLEHRASVKRFVSIQFLNLRQSVGLLGRGISPSQGRYLHRLGSVEIKAGTLVFKLRTNPFITA